MIGWRAKIGLLLPSTNVVLEPEFGLVLPEGVSIHSARMFIENVDVSGLIDMEKNLERATREIASLRPTAIAFGCTSGSMVKGVGYDAEIIKKMEDIVKVPATTTSTAVIKALKKLGIKKVSVATPYIKEVNEEEKIFLEAHGFEVLNIEGLGILEAVELAEVPPYVVYRFAKKLCHPASEGLFISCTDFRTFEILDALEKDLEIPVVSSNQATIWDLLQLAGVRERIMGCGQLLATTP